MAKNYYDILGVDKNFDEDTLKRAYKKACLKYHPDRMGGKSDEEKHEAEERFKDIQEAYECLSDADKRNYYDRTGSMDGYGQGWSAGANFGGFSDFFNMHDMFDFGGFGSHFRSTNKTQAVQPGKNIKITVPVTVEDIFKGSTKHFKYNREVRCEECHGTGGEGIETCKQCNGTGMYTTVQRSGFGVIQNSRPCPYCNATGQTIKHQCKKCKGTGFTNKEDEVEIKVPVFVPNGYTTQISGKGFESKTEGAPSGNLIVQFVYNIDTNKYAIDDSGDVYERIDIPYYDCILGITMKRELPNGVKVDVNVPQYSTDSTQIRIKNKGLRNHDYVYVVNPEFPKSMNKDEKNYLEKIKKLHK